MLENGNVARSSGLFDGVGAGLDFESPEFKILADRFNSPWWNLSVHGHVTSNKR